MAEYYPPAAFFFKVTFELDGTTEQDVNFQEVSGLTSEVGVESIKEGGENRFTHRLPGPAKFPNLVLKRGVVTSSGLIKWFKSTVEDLEVQPVDVTISLRDQDENDLSVWTFVKAWPMKWAFSNLNAQNNAVAIETVELAYQRFWRH